MVDIDSNKKTINASFKGQIKLWIHRRTKAKAKISQAQSASYKQLDSFLHKIARDNTFKK